MSMGVDSLAQAESLQELIDSLAERLQRSVALDDPTLNLIAASRHFGDEDTVRVQSVLGRGVDPELQRTVLSLGIGEFDGPRRVSPPAEMGAKARICAPVRCAGVLFGFLWLIDDGLVDDRQLLDTAAVADQVGMILHRRDLFLQRRQTRCGSLVRELLSADEPTRAGALGEALEEELVPKDAAVVTAAVLRAATPQEDSPDFHSAIAKLAERTTSMGTDPTYLCLPRRHELVVIVAGSRGRGRDSPLAAIRRIAGALSERTGVRTTTGVGRQQETLTAAHQSYQDALVAIRAAQFLPSMGDVVTWESLGVYVLLAKLDPQELVLGPHQTPIVRLISSRNSSVLLSTAETFLDLAGDVQRSAAVLHVHRATLYQRLARIEEVTGLDFSDGGDRLTLHLGLKVARLSGALADAQA
ncbi:CdaR family transcriptional regulator [Nocardioides sp. L-11A]|uniref:PucR family transcriptional regulator n=1 Tax=Nocardioides sp. L-11A TaxID=3043848 RepID=UPI00249C1BE5|nr:helix-turn-helix domain-containing protein [Nocardioides sp. L-11A]